VLRLSRVKLLVSNNSEILRHLGAASFRNLPMEVVVVTGGQEAVAAGERERPSLCILDAELADLSGYQAARRIKNAVPDCRVILILGARITTEQLHAVTECGCDEILIAPMESDQLYDVVAIQLDLPRRGAQRYDIDLAVLSHQGQRSVSGRVSNLSVDGARLMLDAEVGEGTLLRLDIRPSGEPPISIHARVVWAQRREGGSTVGAAFDELDPEVRGRLARLTQWEIVHDTARTRIVIKGDITEATRFDDLLPALVGRIDFDVSQIRYMNSLGVREWIEFLRRAPIQGYEFHACSVAFVLQAAMVEGVTGRGTVSSFFAPYACDRCEYTDERLLQAAAILATEDRQPPEFACPRCGDRLVLDDIPERYLAFLQSAADE
jgi:DNA-binding response OmpR family regulator